MGQSIVVNEKPSSNPGVVRFETNRAITGMGHERYPAGTEVWGERPPDELARRLLARGGVANVQINGNVVTVDLEKGYDATGLKAIIENLYRFYPETPAEEVVAIAADAAEQVHEAGTADPTTVTPDLEGVAPVEPPAAAEPVGDAPSPDAAAAPEQAAEPGDATPAVADDAPAPDPVEEPVPAAAEPAAAEPEPAAPDEVAVGTEADPEVAAAPESDPESATAPAPAADDDGSAGASEADPEVAAAPESDPESATAPDADPV